MRKISMNMATTFLSKFVCTIYSCDSCPFYPLASKVELVQIKRKFQVKLMSILKWQGNNIVIMSESFDFH